MPAFPGVHASAVTAGSAAKAKHSACSRAPEPITRTRTVAEPSAAFGSPTRNQSRPSPTRRSCRPAPRACRPATRDSRLATGDWRLATGDWRLATGDWRGRTGYRTAVRAAVQRPLDIHNRAFRSGGSCSQRLRKAQHRRRGAGSGPARGRLEAGAGPARGRLEAGSGRAQDGSASRRAGRAPRWFGRGPGRRRSRRCARRSSARAPARSRGR